MKRGVLQVLGKKLSNCQQSKSTGLIRSGGRSGWVHFANGFSNQIDAAKGSRAKAELRSKFMRDMANGKWRKC
uniref:HDC14619 n=1 Tax=Drosophila melanogaster TaxID=7227 RepID=Q6IJM2_DROME|nr:TPA_inf: HDC14619 [Drosophila melanogaster]